MEIEMRSPSHWQKRNIEGEYIGPAHSKPILDSRIFMIRFADGEEKDIAYNILAEHLYSQVVEEGNQCCLFKEIFNHQRNENALDKADLYMVLTNGKQIPTKSTAGWDFEVEWKDGTTSWLPLKESKETNGVEVAQYANDNRLIEEPAFTWCAPHYLKKMKRLIKLSKTRHVRNGYKFGICVPNTIEEAIALDIENNNTLW
jgi:hypothetical protein